MSILPDPSLAFDISNSQFMAKLPLMRARLEQDADEIRQQVLELKGKNGPLKVKLAHRRDNRFSDLLFDWVMVARNAQEEKELEEIEDLTMWTSEYSKSHNGPALQAELDAAIGPHKRIGGFGVNPSIGTWWAHDSYHDINHMLRDYMRYRFYQTVLDNSEPVEELRQLGADWSYEARMDNPLLVVPDKKIGLMLKLKY